MKEYNRLHIDEVHTDNLLYEIKRKLEGNGFSVVILNDISKIKKLIEDHIPDEAEVGLDGSDIISELNIPVLLRENWNVIIDPFYDENPTEIKNYMKEKLKTAEYYITSPEAITMDGKVVFKNKNRFLTSGKQEKPDNIIAFVGSESICENLGDVQSNNNKSDLTVLEISPYGLKRRAIDNYGQIEEYHDLMTDQSNKQNTFTIVLLAEEYVY